MADNEKEELIKERRELRVQLQKLYDGNAPKSETKPIADKIDKINQQLKGHGVNFSEY